jgi:hypothetical protein
VVPVSVFYNRLYEASMDSVNWQKDFMCSADRLDPYKHIGQVRAEINEEILKAIQLLQNNGYDVYRRKE